MFLTLETTSGERSFCFIFFMFFSELFISLRLKTKQKKGGGEGEEGGGLKKSLTTIIQLFFKSTS